MSSSYAAQPAGTGTGTATGTGTSTPTGQIPQSMNNAVKLMYAGAALAGLNFVLGLFMIGVARREMRDDGLTRSEVNAGTAVYVTMLIIMGLIAVGLWLWMAQSNKRGKSWARIVATVFFAISTIALISSFFQRGNHIVSDIVGILAWLVGLGAVYFLWRPESTQYYESQSAKAQER